MYIEIRYIVYYNIDIVKCFKLMNQKNNDVLIVVARYNEDVSWTRQFDNVIIYNKGDELVGYDKVIKLDNVGRECHTYYKHICDNYDNLNEYTVFLQGDPSDHCRNFTRIINRHIRNKNLNIDFEFINGTINSKLEGCRHHKGLQMVDLYEKIFGERVEKGDLKFGAGAQFIVSKKNILKNAKEFYLNIVTILGYSICPREAYEIERLHGCIFSTDYKPL